MKLPRYSALAGVGSSGHLGFSYLASSIDKEKGGASAKLLTLLPLWDKQ
jgi:hypothetical protein